MPLDEKLTRISTNENVNGLKILILLDCRIVPDPLQHESRHPYSKTYHMPTQLSNHTTHRKQMTP